MVERDLGAGSIDPLDLSDLPPHVQAEIRKNEDFLGMLRRMDYQLGSIVAAAQNQSAEIEDIDLDYLAQFGMQNPGPDDIGESDGSNGSGNNPDNPGCFGRLLRPVINLKGQVVQLIAFLWGSTDDPDTESLHQRFKAQQAAKKSMNKKLVELSIEKGLPLPRPRRRRANPTTVQLLAESRRWRIKKMRLNSLLAASAPDKVDSDLNLERPSDEQ